MSANNPPQVAPSNAQNDQSLAIIVKGKVLYSITVGQRNYLRGTSRALEALQSYMNDSYHKSVLYWPEPTINPWTSRVMVRIIFG